MELTINSNLNQLSKETKTTTKIRNNKEKTQLIATKIMEMDFSNQLLLKWTITLMVVTPIQIDNKLTMLLKWIKNPKTIMASLKTSVMKWKMKKNKTKILRIKVKTIKIKELPQTTTWTKTARKRKLSLTFKKRIC
jgi:hypothetical protein